MRNRIFRWRATCINFKSRRTWIILTRYLSSCKLLSQATFFPCYLPPTKHSQDTCTQHTLSWHTTERLSTDLLSQYSIQPFNDLKLTVGNGLPSALCFSVRPSYSSAAVASAIVFAYSGSLVAMVSKASIAARPRPVPCSVRET